MGFMGMLKLTPSVRAPDAASRPQSVDMESRGALRSGATFSEERASLLRRVTDTSVPLYLADAGDDAHSRLPMLSFNAVVVELRDLFRIVGGLLHRARAAELGAEHIAAFYEWFEGFFSIVTCVFDAEEDVLFAWLGKVAAMKPEYALSGKRRKKKKERAKGLCWDILELKLEFDTTAQEGVDLLPLVLEIQAEAEMLASRLLVYMSDLVREIPRVLQDNFGCDERLLIEEALVTTFRACGPGRFVICAYARGIPDFQKQEGFLVESFKNSKTTQPTAQKRMKKFQQKHVDIANSLATDLLTIVNDEPSRSV